MEDEAERLLWTLEELPDPYPDWATARRSEPVMRVIDAILGVPVDDYDQFQRWADDITLGPRDAARSTAAARAMTEYLTPIVEERRRHPCGDLLSELVTAEVDGHVLDDDHIYGF